MRKDVISPYLRESIRHWVLLASHHTVGTATWRRRMGFAMRLQQEACGGRVVTCRGKGQRRSRRRGR